MTEALYKQLQQETSENEHENALKIIDKSMNMKNDNFSSFATNTQ